MSAPTEKLEAVLTVTDSSEGEEVGTKTVVQNTQRKGKRGKNKGNNSNTASSSSTATRLAYNMIGVISSNTASSSNTPPLQRGTLEGNEVVSTMEVFSGSGNLSNALGHQGFNASAIDIANDPEDDLANPSSVPALVEEVVHTNTRYAHLAPPCNTFSIARYPKIRTCVGIN